MPVMKFAGINTLREFLGELDRRYLNGEYELKKLESAEDSYLASYVLMKNNTKLGDTINIPRDYLVKSCKVRICNVNDYPVEGYRVNDRYIDFTVNSVEGEGNQSHIYLRVSDMISPYKSGSGVVISDANSLSILINDGNGLSVNTSGLSLALATSESPGAMSASDKEKLGRCPTNEDFEEITEIEIISMLSRL